MTGDSKLWTVVKKKKKNPGKESLSRLAINLSHLLHILSHLLHNVSRLPTISGHV